MTLAVRGPPNCCARVSRPRTPRDRRSPDSARPDTHNRPRCLGWRPATTSVPVARSRDHNLTPSPAGFEESAESPQKLTSANSRAAFLHAVEDPRLRTVVSAWNTLPPTKREAIYRLATSND